MVSFFGSGVGLMNSELTGTGSDFPYASPEKTRGFKELLDAFPMDQNLRDKIYLKNAESILSGHGSERGKFSL